MDSIRENHALFSYQSLTNHMHKGKVTYLRGDATLPQSSGNKIIAHVSNIDGKWGKGFVMSISSRFGEMPKSRYQEWFRGRRANDFELGSVQFVPICHEIIVANMLAQQGVGHVMCNGASLRHVQYDSLRKCLEKVQEIAIELNASVHMPRIGTGLGGGTWDEVEPIILKSLNEVQVFVYDL